MLSKDSKKQNNNSLKPGLQNRRVMQQCSNNKKWEMIIMWIVLNQNKNKCKNSNNLIRAIIIETYLPEINQFTNFNNLTLPHLVKWRC